MFELGQGLWTFPGIYSEWKKVLTAKNVTTYSNVFSDKKAFNFQLAFCQLLYQKKGEKMFRKQFFDVWNKPGKMYMEIMQKILIKLIRTNTLFV